MKRFVVFSIVAGLVLPMAGCANNQEAGTGTGAVLGALLGSQFGRGDGQVLAAAAGAVAGGYVGNQVGKNIDETNRLRMEQAVGQTQDNHSKSWTDEKHGQRYTVKPARVYMIDGRRCRHFTASIVMRGDLKTADGLACQRSDGTWQIMPEKDQ